MGLAKRIIPCLDVDAGRVVKGVKFVDIRDAGDPVEIAAGYEQQGAIMEEFVCCRALDPSGARTERLYGILRDVFPGNVMPSARLDAVALAGLVATCVMLVLKIRGAILFGLVVTAILARIFLHERLSPMRLLGVALAFGSGVDPTNETLMAVPLFVFMGVTLERAHIAEELLETLSSGAEKSTHSARSSERRTFSSNSLSSGVINRSAFFRVCFRMKSAGTLSR